MPRYSAEDARRLGEIRADLETLVDGGTSALAAIVEPLAELLATERTFAYSLTPRGEGFRIDQMFGAGMGTGPLRDAMDRCFEGEKLDATVYNPIQPEPWQRNAALTLRALRDAGKRPEETLVWREVWPRFGLRGCDQLRVLVCDGPSLLAWVGGYQPDPYDTRQRRLLTALIKPLCRRLILERQLSTAGFMQVALEAALEGIGCAAFLLSTKGAVIHANAAAQATLVRGGRSVRTRLAQAARAKPGSSCGAEVTPLRRRGAAEGYLVILREPQPSARLEAQVASAAARWGLSPRRRQVLALVAQGLTNQTIAAMLGVSERSVELHVSAIFDLVGVGNRAALIALILL